MLEVSEKLMELAQSSGRQVRCRIEAGNEAYLDDRILEFDFDDVVHPDWFTLGTTCANRFSFSVRYGAQLNVRDIVKPYISFDGEEWCPLGIFYVARRYVRGNYATITCYDRMYSLDMKYETSLSFPADTAAVLEDICTSCGIECADYGNAYEVESIPENATVRDVIGYIAAINLSCAKIDRYGALVMKKTGSSVFMLRDTNCWSIQRNMEQSVITCVKADNGSEVLTAGNGAEISTLEFYNPLISQQRVESIYRLLRPFSFYGADIEMQGMPFIEAGDVIQIHEDKLLYQLVVSEIEYHYEKGLTAHLYSKNRCYTDAAVHVDDLNAALEELKTQFGAFCFQQTNRSQLTLSEQAIICADFEFEAALGGFAQVDLNMTADGFTADFVIIEAWINGVMAEHYGVQSLNGEGCRELLHCCWLADNLPSGKNRIFITLRTKSGSAYIMPNMLLATVVGHGAKFRAGGNADKLSLFDLMEGIPICDMMFVPAKQTAELYSE